MKRQTKKCNYCGKDMLVSKGQVAYFHGKCRSKGRHIRKHNK